MACKVYIAGRYSQKVELNGVASLLRDNGHVVTASWLEEDYAPNITLDQVPDDDLAQLAVVDIQDIQMADTLAFFSCDPATPTHRGGRHVEMGVAIALNKQIIVVGPKENIFHYLPGVCHVQDEQALIAVLNEKGEV
jgi:nucleoside 2-deoxyribosyltransferase